MAAGAAEPVVEIEVAEGGIEIVEPHQADDAPAEPDAFGIAGRTVDGLGRLGEFVGLALVVPWRRRPAGRALAVAALPDWSWGAGIAALGEAAAPKPISRASPGKAKWRKTANRS